MSKFCGNCGTQLDDSAKVCGNCGTPLALDNRTIVANDIPGVSYKDPEKVAKTKKTIKTIVSIVVLIAIVITGFNIVSGFVGYKGTVRKVMNAYKDFNIDEIVDISSDIYFYDYDGYKYDYFENIVSSDFDNIEGYIGHDYKLSYKIKDAYKLSDRKLDDFIEGIDAYGENIDLDMISSLMSVEVEIIAKEGKRSTEFEKNLILSKEDGKWKLVFIYDNLYDNF